MTMKNPLPQRDFQMRRRKKTKKKLTKGQRHWGMRTVSIAS
jgi:hypothetical protein